jgi:signal transduction histidine kinase
VGLKGFDKIKLKIKADLKEPLYSDRQFLHSIIHNLISNAFTHRKKTNNDCITISANNEKDTVVIKVMDNGTGIPDNMKNKIFEKFQKGDKSANGTGLGLYIVKNLVGKLNGTIIYSSEQMKGTNFIIHLPIKHTREVDKKMKATTTKITNKKIHIPCC